jgi:microcystin-dependent protein
MPSPIISTDFDNQSINGSLCDQFRQKLLNNDQIAEFLAWFLDANGNFNYDNVDSPATFGADLAANIADATSGWLLCDGSDVSKTQYPKLFALIGSTYGAAVDAVNNFRLPSLGGKFLIGKSGSYALASSGGAATDSVTLTTANLPDHQHKTFLEDTLSSGGLIGTATNDWVSIEGGKVFFKVGDSAKTYYMRTKSEPSIFEGAAFTVDTVPPYTSVSYYIRAGWKIGSYKVGFS